VKDGVAIGHPDTREVRNRVDSEPDWYGFIEGCIVHGGVQAIAYRRWTEDTYDAQKWLYGGEQVKVGTVTHTKITAGSSLLLPGIIEEHEDR
jgi:hypothetical protein